MYNVLIIDDKEAFRRKIIRMQYFKENTDKMQVVFTAQNGVEALDILKKHKVDIVLTDIRMPLVDGLELLLEIKKENLCKCTILISEYSDFSYAREGIINGAFDYIIKPVDEEMISQVLNRAYVFLEEEKKGKSPFTQQAKMIADNILRGTNRRKDLENLLLEEIRKNCHSENEMMTSMNYVLQEMKDYLVTKAPDLTNYVPLKELCVMDTVCLSEVALEKAFCNKITCICQEVDTLFIKTDSNLINDICDYILKNVEKKVSLQKITEEFFLNKKYLSSLFYKKTNIYYKDYMITVKIERAKMLLSYSDMKVYEIAAKLGFTDSEYFSKVFKKKTGFAPSEFHWKHLI